MKRLLRTGLIAALVLPIAAQGADQATDAKRPEPFEVKSQIHARYVAAGQEDERKGLWGPSENFPVVLTNEDKFGETGKLSLVASPDETVPSEKYPLFRLRVVNRSDERVTFSAIDSHLFMVQEARDEKGEWRPIERIPHGTGPRDCAVGFHRMSLKPGQYWNVIGLRYGGPLKTKLRFRLDLGRNDRAFPSPGGKLIYSNEFDGSIHREQFEHSSGLKFRDLNAPTAPATKPASE